ncbi:hypothetical protein [Stieleria neptunia]|uniref:hypothetical protein n=1 Tax=Stieleria neptunia TaxID=2527979 RepID=UPI0011A2A592|nr:hypothetical protein [Stieleria neptunia]
MDNRLKFLPVPWPPPKPSEGQQKAYSHKSIDKGLKLSHAIRACREIDPEFVYVVDADDWVSGRVTEFVAENRNCDGFYVDQGHFVNWQRKTYKQRRGLLDYCGSTYCAPYYSFCDLMPGISECSERPGIEELRAAIPEQFLERGFGDHTIPRLLRQHGRRLQPFPFFAAAWVMNHGENIYGLADSDRGRPFSPTFLQRYGLENELSCTIAAKSGSIKTLAIDQALYYKSSLDFALRRWRRQSRV